MFWKSTENMEQNTEREMKNIWWLSGNLITFIVK